VKVDRRDCCASGFTKGLRHLRRGAGRAKSEDQARRNLLPMSDLARRFLAQWEFEHINVVARAVREEHARRLTEQCRADAAKAGINKWALEIVAGGRSCPQHDSVAERS
jgi:hypothetical protein